MRKQRTETDWTKYYGSKKNFFSTYTQKFTLAKIVDAYESYCKNDSENRVMELGGGNSCFVEEFCSQKPVKRYDIVDSNELAVSLFESKMKEKHIAHRGYLFDLTEPIEEKDFLGKYDFVYSVGLIEHFTTEQRKQVLGAHFALAKMGGAVFITFPTPTLKYRFWRRVMEILGVWQFYDETPLVLSDVKDVLEKYGTIVSSEINRKLFLTQMLVLVIKDK